MSEKIDIKSVEEIEIMKEGGTKLAKIRRSLEKAVRPGVSAEDLDKLAEGLINKSGCKPSFKMVPNYFWSTCVNVNDGVVHGVPKRDVVFKDGDLVSIDVGVYYRGFHTDTSISIIAGDDRKKLSHFLDVGKSALKEGMSKSIVGNRIGDISWAIESTLKEAKLNPIRALVGHGVGRKLHEAPFIPCFVSGSNDEKLEIQEGWTLAIEVMYTLGDPDLVLDEDNWTIRTKDGRISGLFEETVAVTQNGPIILTN